MRVRAGDVSLWFEVRGTKYVPDGQRFVERPTIVSVHGGPGLDSGNDVHSLAGLADFAQLVVYDQRGHGRSDHSTPDRWNLDTWADDIVALCDALGIDKPIVMGTSFGGFVVQRYLARHPDHPLGAVLVVTTPRIDAHESVERFRQLGGDEVADIVRRDLEHSTPETVQQFLDVCLPLMSRRPGAKEYLAERLARTIRTDEVNLAWVNGDAKTVDLRPGLAALRCPTLLLVGEHDPVTPPTVAREIVDAAPTGLVEYVEIPDAGHLVLRDAPERFEAAVRQFVERLGATPSRTAGQPGS